METYRSAYTKSKMLPANVTVTAGTLAILGKYQIMAGEMVQLGYGANDSQEGASGRIYVDIKDTTPAAVQGTLRFTVYSPQMRPLRILAEYRTETLRTDAANRTLQVPFSSNGMPFLSEDKFLALEFVPDAGATVSSANSTVLFDITQAVL